MLSDRAKKNVVEFIAELTAKGAELDPKVIAQELSYTVSNVKDYLNELYPSAGRLPVIPTFNSVLATATSKTAKDAGKTDPDTFVIRFNLTDLAENQPAKKNANKSSGETAKIGYNKNTRYIKIAANIDSEGTDESGKKIVVPGGVVIGGVRYYMQPIMLTFTTNKDGVQADDFVVTSEAEKVEDNNSAENTEE